MKAVFIVVLSLITSLLTMELGAQTNCCDHNDFDRFSPYFNVKMIVSIPIFNRIGKTHSFLPDFSLSASAGAQINSKHVQGHFVATSTFFRGGIGTSLIPLGQTDMRFETMVTAAIMFTSHKIRSDVEGEYSSFIPTFHSRSAAYLPLSRKIGGALGTHFLFSKKRNQQIGFVNFEGLFNASGATGIQVHYYNDGTPFQWIGIADSFDRWWTGGASLKVNFKDPDTWMRVGFDKFTGGGKTSQRDAFAFANLLALKIVDYTGEEFEEIFLNRNITYGEISFNRIVRIRLESSSELGDFQHAIHHSRKDAFHHNYSSLAGKTFVIPNLTISTNWSFY